MRRRPPAFAVFDSSALIAFLQNEKGGDIVRGLLRENTIQRYVHTVNLCEVYYHLHRIYDAGKARSLIQRLQAIGLQERTDADTAFWQDAGDIKAVRAKVSLADCFLLALARRLNAEVVTSDKHELQILAADGVARIRFIR